MSYLLWLLSKLSELPFSNRRPGFGRVGWVDDLGQWLRDVIGTLWELIADLASAVMDWFVQLIQPALDAVADMFVALVDWLSSVFQPIVDWFGETFESIVNWFSETITAIWEWIAQGITDAYTWVVDLFKAVLDWWLAFCMGFWEWIIGILEALFDAGVDLLKDSAILMLQYAAEFAAYAVESIPVPEFVQHNAIGTMLGQAGPVVGWVASTLRLQEALALIAAAFAFRILRKVLTLFQW